MFKVLPGESTATCLATSPVAETQGSIPRVFHLVWLSGEDKPSMVTQCLESWRATNPTFAVREWKLDDLDWQAVPFCAQAVKARKWAFATDVLRLMILKEHGGIYLDSDVMLHGPVEQFCNGEGFIPWEDEQLLGPHVIAARKGSPIITDWLAGYQQRQFLLTEDVIDITPMPDVITRISIERHGLDVSKPSKTITDGFRLLAATVGTSKLDDRCVFEHLYEGSWLADKHTNFRAIIQHKNRKGEKRRRRPLQALLPLAALLRFRKQRKRAKNDARSFSANLWTLHGHPGNGPTRPYHLATLAPAIPRALPQFVKPLVSIIVPVYNVENYLPRCLNSLINQTYQRIEILVVNDGATDSSATIARRAAEADSRVILHRKPNGGLGSARNHGLDLIKGDYVGFVDGDDWVSPTYVENFLAHMGPATDVVVCNHVKVLADGRTVSFSACGGDTVDSDPALHLFRTDVECYAWNKLFRAACFTRPDFRFGESLFEDFAIIPAILGAAHQITFTQQHDYFYVQRPGSILSTAQGNADNQFAIFKAFDQLIQKQPFFKPERWVFYYEHKLAQHLFLYRKDPILAVSDEALRQETISRFGKELTARMPSWHKTSVVRGYMREGDGRRNTHNRAIVEAFLRGGSRV